MASANHIIVRPMICLVLILTLVGVHIIAALSNFPAFLQLFIQSVICVYLGCFFSAKIKRQAEGQIKRVEKEEDQETMSSKDAYMFPVYGSFVLFSLYCAYKFLPPAWLNIIFTGHFTFIGLFCLASFVELPIVRILGASKSEEYSNLTVIDRVFKLDLGFIKKEFPIKLNFLDSICISVAILPSVFYAGTKNWILNNLFGIAFSIVGIENLNLPNFKTGFILLWGLFFYDIFWVYGTDVMVTVAKNFNVPIKLMFPYQWWPTEDDGEDFAPKFSMLGLGDIVIPGIFVALCLKYDFDRRLKNIKNVHSVQTPYFNWCFGGYVAGIITTYVVMVVFKHAQPALLFLVPGCTGAVAIKALLDNNFKGVWEYEEEEGRDKKPVEAEQKKEEDKKEQ